MSPYLQSILAAVALLTSFLHFGYSLNETTGRTYGAFYQPMFFC
jgi:hypothetical protein